MNEERVSLINIDLTFCSLTVFGMKIGLTDPAPAPSPFPRSPLAQLTVPASPGLMATPVPCWTGTSLGSWSSTLPYSHWLHQ